ncbi:zf-U1-domain-containing protein [Coccomyxa subellipsoidea C-169]|uniref:U1 small nuclear ribonucleoprotein C n=1 Tax=Coccomyxa subellipsoidea (strain C-169) TaxID=574566 RepID=I0YJG7_COCSC|nr:zf-U1-domain-containing protein [Coccomyxa subellipsoidea C-169]EIE18536.1 zf-U1-domain-containing protein [Coccomyxa subellipsoidea C-169]|eukprot:XP_005643080.1 zf-U1-domain-containing protein [Coccomyxa subellipsoidea C-169]
MTRYYCDYCDTYLTHDSPVVRKQHNDGYKHKANVRNYYMQFEESQTQSLIDSKIMEFEAKTRNAFQAQVAASFQAQMMGRGAGPMPGAPGMPPRPMGPPMMGMPPGRPPMGPPPHGFPGKSSCPADA